MALAKKEISMRLQQIRTEKKKTRAQVVDAIGCSREALWYWETGHALPGVEFLFKLCEYYGVSVDKTFDLRVANATNAKLSAPVVRDYAQSSPTQQRQMNKYTISAYAKGGE